jgi:K(+)-stimulated pyrophosphate-energized sodium pump
MDPMWISGGAGILGLLFAVYLVRFVLARDMGTDKMKEISMAIQEGAQAFLGREYRILAVFVIVVAIILGLVPNLGWLVSLTFVFGAVSSALAGFIGMSVAVRSNARTAAAAKESVNEGLRVSFRAGGVMGMTVVSIGLLGLTILYFLLRGHANFLSILPGYGFGASGVAIFARVGGGIFTKAADTGADLVGKVEQNIPEDDPRNAAVIADFVGDNVGDTAGMGADLFESYVDSIIATMTLASIAVLAKNHLVGNETTAWFLPMLVAAGGILASIVGAFFVRVGLKADMDALLGALRRGTVVASVLVAAFSFGIVKWMGADLGIFWAIVAGLVAGVLIGESTSYFTSYAHKPTQRISQACQTGAATAIIEGYAAGLMSVLPPVIFVGAAVLTAYHCADTYGVAIAGIGMLATLGITLATDAYGPVADNAGGIVEMSGLPHEIRERTDALDSLGNTTAATGKGFAIGSAALTSLALMLSYTEAVGVDPRQLSILDTKVLVALFLGASLPAIFCSMTLTAVGRTGFTIINEVRRQFREIPGLMEGTGRPEYGKCVDICTAAALRQMILPGVMTVVSPVLVGFVLGAAALTGFLAGAIVSGFILAVSFANAGGAWDNAKKFIEAGNYGGKGSVAHKAGVVGDTVGDPMKDTSGPSLNIMIKLMSIIALVVAPVLKGKLGLF